MNPPFVPRSPTITTSKAAFADRCSDWERAIVIWGQNGDGSWQPSKIMLSQHSGYKTIAWGSIQNTLNSGDETQQIGGPNGRQNLDHAKVYVAWSKPCQLR